MNMENWSAYIEWLVVVLLLGSLVYTMIVIKREKQVYIDNGIPLRIRHFKFLIPHWWGVNHQDDETVEFERKDTRYDWKAKIQWLPEKENHQNIEEKFKTLIGEKEILFDEQNSVIHYPKDSATNNSDLPTHLPYEMVRIEGTATQYQTERIYYDAFLLHDNENSGYLFCESRSSVLNGLVEGPYFEEVIKRVKPVSLG